jgi:predicted MFS family arabinose efflux permease
MTITEPPTAPSALDKPGVVLAAAALGVAAVLVFALLPIISGVMAEHYRLADEQIGLVALAYFGVYALVALSSSLWVRRVNWRRACSLGFAIMFAGLGLCSLSDTFLIAQIGLAVTGFGAALLFPVSLTLVSDMTHTDRTYAIKLSAEQLVPAALLFLLSSALLTGYGKLQLMLALQLLLVAAFFLSHGLPSAGRPASAVVVGHSRSPALSVLSLLALCVNFAGFAGLWAFLERLGNARQFDEGFVATWLGVGLITSGLGPLGAAFIEDRFGRLSPLLAATAISLLSLAWLTGQVDERDFSLVLFLLPLSYYFSIAYLYGTVASADFNGKMAGQMSFALAVGAAFGPALFGILLSQDGPVVLAMGLLIGGGALIMALIQWRLQSAVTTEEA